MEFHFLAPDLRVLGDTSAELIVCTIWRDERPLRGLASLVDWRLAGRLSALLASGYVLGDLGEALLIPVKPQLPFEKLVVLGLGPRAGFGDGAFRKVIAQLGRTLEGLRVRRAVIELPGRADGAMDPERATEIVLESLGDSPEHDAWWLVENTEGERRVRERALDERRRMRRG